MKRIGILAAFFVVGCLGHPALAAESPKPVELKVLEKFEGTWDCEIVTKPAVCPHRRAAGTRGCTTRAVH